MCDKEHSLEILTSLIFVWVMTYMMEKAVDFVAVLCDI